MPTDLLERVRSEIEERLAVLSGAVSEAQQLEAALVALGEEVGSSRSAADAGDGHHRRRKASRGLLGHKARRRKRAHAGVNDETVVGSLQGEAEPLDIKTVAGKTGLSQQTASYTLKKLAGKGLLTQSSVAGARGRPKLVFALPATGQTAKGGATSSKASPTRKARKKAQRRSKAPRSARAN
jgi:Fic family protein